MNNARMAVDFGTSNTVIAVWDEAAQQGQVLHIPQLSHFYQQSDGPVSVIPSLIHYASGQQRWLGEQVLERDLYRHPHTFRWMKRYILNRSPLSIRIGERSISPSIAGRDFLTSVLLFANQELDLQVEEIALSVPVEAFEHYEDWLGEVAQSVQMPRWRLIDEPSAAALGYGAHIQPGDVYLIFDFGGGTLHASVVLVEDDDISVKGRRCRVLGKAGLDLGGATIDQWIFQEVLRRNQRLDSDEDIRQISNALLVGCERIKEDLTHKDSAALHITNPITGADLHAEFSRATFEHLLDQNDLFAQIDRTLRRAIRAASERGYDAEAVKAVLAVGGSSQIPAVQSTLRRIFGRERVLAGRPLDAVARGAAAFVAGVDFFDHIQHDYAIRYLNQGRYDYRAIVSRGAPYPSTQPVARLRIKAAQENQVQLGLAIFEIGHNPPESASAVELVFDPSGAARVMPVSPDEVERRTRFWMNENQLTFLTAEPPASPGEDRFEVEFNIDANKRLLITARDLLTGKLTHQNYPVIKLV
jgi:molecular chaperone DnaK (HSP70)